MFHVSDLNIDLAEKITERMHKADFEVLYRLTGLL